MSEVIPAGFSSDEFFRRMKRLWGTNQEEAGAFLMKQVRKICRQLVWETGNGFYNVTADDFEDYAQEAWIKMWLNMDKFLSDPMNDPDSKGPHYSPPQKASWARSLILWEMKHLRDRKMGKNPIGTNGQRIQVISLDQPVNSNDHCTPLGAFIPDRNSGPVQLSEDTDSVRDALKELLNLSNNSETLAAVTYVIISNALGHKQSMNDYAEILNQWTIYQTIESIEMLLVKSGMDPSWLSFFRQRVEKEGGDRPMTGLTAAKLTNRKNDIQSILRKRIDSRDK